MDREKLKQELKRFKERGLTQISLRSSESELRNEWLRIMLEIHPIKTKKATSRQKRRGKIMKTDYPCWLTKDELAIAQKLIDLGYYYAGNFSEEDEEDEFGDVFVFPVLGKAGKFTLYSGTGELCLIAEIKGAAYVLSVESPDEFKPLLNKTLRILRAEIKRQKQQNNLGFKQLCLI